MSETLETISNVAASGVPAERATAMLRWMLLARKTDERLMRLYHQGAIYGGVYAGVGQEAIGAATVAVSGPDDLFAPLIRNMSVHIARGQSIRNIFRHWLGRANGPTAGRDGNVHHGNMANGVYAMISHLGAMIPVVVGGVMARRRQGRDCVGFAYIGDGATSTGDFHEAINFAAVYDVPLVAVIENNQYAYSLPVARQTRCRQFIDKAAGYGIEGLRLDGNDVFAIFQALKPLVDDLRRHPRTILVECDTMRMRGHGEHDDFSYGDRATIESYKLRDPITLARRRILDEGLMTPPQLDALELACTTEVDTAYPEALSDPKPRPESLLEGVYPHG